jgi:festuclavine dehydrogenase
MMRYRGFCLRIPYRELLTDAYQQVAAIFSTVLGRKISHVKLTESESIEHMKSCGMPEDVATLLTGQDILAKNRVDDRLNNAVEDITGMPPEKFAEFVTREMACWSQI